MIPFKNLLNNESNVYELTCVAIKEAEIYASVDMGKEIEKNGKRIVSVVLDRALKGEIEYTTQNENK